MVLITYVDYLSCRTHLFTLAELLHGLVCCKLLKSLFLPTEAVAKLYYSVLYALLT